MALQDCLLLAFICIRCATACDSHDQTGAHSLLKPFTVGGIRHGRGRRVTTPYDHSNANNGIDRRSNLGLQEFYDVYDGKWPVIITDVVSTWKAANWSSEFFRNNYSDDRVTIQTFKAPSHREGESIRLGDFIADVGRATAGAWSYVTDELFLSLRPALAADIGHSVYFAEDYFELFPAAVRPWSAMLLWGSRHSMSLLHIDPYNWTGTNAVIFGLKQWKLYPPGQDALLYINPNMQCGFPLNCWKYNSDADTFHPDFEKFPLLKNAVSLNVDQHPGDLLIIPPGWYHQVYNAEETLAVSGELMNRNNYRVVLEEILAYGEVSRDCLPRNIDQLAGREQVMAVVDCIPPNILEAGKLVNEKYREMTGQGEQPPKEHREL